MWHLYGRAKEPALSPYRLNETWLAGVVFVPVFALDLTPGKQCSSPSLFLMWGVEGKCWTVEMKMRFLKSRGPPYAQVSLCFSLPQAGREVPQVSGAQHFTHVLLMQPHVRLTFWNHCEKLRKSNLGERHIILMCQHWWGWSPPKPLKLHWREQRWSSWSYSGLASYLHNTIFCTGIEVEQTWSWLLYKK